MDSIKLKINGMSCGHCEMTVQGALEKVDGVKSANVNLKKKSADIELNKEIDNSVLVNAVKKVGFDAELS